MHRPSALTQKIDEEESPCAGICDSLAETTMLDASCDLPACTECAKCCHYVVELRAGVDVVPEEFVVEHDGVRCMDQHGDGACVALDRVTRRCTIYEQRPQVCRELDRGGDLCRRAVRGRRGSLAPDPAARA